MTTHADKRSVATDALETLGTLIDSNQKRDAIHLAGEPVVAGQYLFPGQRIRIIEGEAFGAKDGDAQGIVDPFLPEVGINKGERFWFVMKPRMVHSLRHVWTHPDFPDEPGTSAAQASALGDSAASERWLRNWCAMNDTPGYDAVIAVIVNGSWSDEDGESSGYIDDEYIHFSGVDAHAAIPPEFWDHVEVVTGVRWDEKDRPESFSCSC